MSSIGQAGENITIVVQGTSKLEIADGSGIVSNISLGINFSAPAETLILDDPSHFSGVISDFNAGDTLELTNLTLTSAALDSGNILNLSSASGAVELQLDPTVNFAGESFLILADGKDGTEVVVEDNSQTLSFTGPNQLLLVIDPAQVSGVISGFAAGDTIDLAGLAATSVSLGANNTLQVTEANGTLLSIQFDGKTSFSGGLLESGPDGNGGTNVTLSSVSIQPADPVVEDNAGSEIFTITRSGNTSEATTVYVSTTDGTSVAGESIQTNSFTPLNFQPVTFSSGSADAMVTINLSGSQLTSDNQLYGLVVTDAASVEANVLATDSFTLEEAPANPVYEASAGAVQSGNEYTVDLGTLTQGDAGGLTSVSILNDVLYPADDLSGTFNVLTAGGFDNEGFEAVSSLRAGDEESVGVVQLDTDTAGTFSETIEFLPASSATGSSSQAPTPQILVIQGTVLPAPTPGGSDEGDTDGDVGTGSTNSSFRYFPGTGGYTSYGGGVGGGAGGSSSGGVSTGGSSGSEAPPAIYIPLPEASPYEPPPPISPRGGANGEPHLGTFTGGKYDFQAVGEFVLAESTTGSSFQVQARLSPLASTPFSIITQVAVEVGVDRVTFDASRSQPLWIDGQAVTLSATPIVLAGGTITQSGSGVSIHLATGENVTVSLDTEFSALDVGVALAPGATHFSVNGLLGDDSGNKTDDLTLADGTPLTQPLDPAVLYGSFADSWRVTDATSLLDYGAGQDTATFTDKSFPGDYVGLAAFPSDLVTAAEALVQQAGITDQGLQEAVTLDYLVSGDPSFLTQAANLQQEGIVSTSDAVAAEQQPPIVGVYAPQLQQIESASGPTTVQFLFYRTGDTSAPLTLNYTADTPDDTFLAAADFGGALPSGTVTFGAGESRETVSITVPNGIGTAVSKSLELTVSAPAGVIVGGLAAQTELIAASPTEGTPPVFALDSSSGAPVQSGNNWTLDLGTFVQGSIPAPDGIRVLNNALAGADSLDGYLTVTGDGGIAVSFSPSFLALQPGAAQNLINVQADTSQAGAHTETVTFNLFGSNLTGFDAAIATQTLTITSDVIVNDDASFAIAADNAVKPEGNSGTTPFTFLVTRTGYTGAAQSLSYAVAGSGTNPADATDFGGTLPSGTVTFAAGATTAAIVVPVSGDTTFEPNETFSVTLSGSPNITVASATGTILNDGASPGTTNPDVYYWTATTGGYWSDVANWNDSTIGRSPAVIPPGSNNFVYISGPATGVPQLVTGPGNAQRLTFQGGTTLIGTFNAGIADIGAAGSAATVRVAAGTTVTTNYIDIPSGSLQVTGQGAVLTAASGINVGLSYIQATATLTVSAGGAVQLGELVLGSGLPDGAQVTVYATSSLEIGTAGSAAPGKITIDPGATISGYGSLSAQGGIVDNGTIDAVGTLVLGSSVSGTGVIKVENGATADLSLTTGPSMGAVTFAGSIGTLDEGSGDSFNIRNTGSGTDTVNLAGSGDYAGLLGGSGYVVSGSNATVGTWDNTNVSLTGNNDLVFTDAAPAGSSTASSGGTVTGTGDTLDEGSGDSFNVQNTGSGTDKVVFSGTGDYVGLLGGSGYTVTGSNGGIETFTNTSFNVTGDNDTIGTDVPVGSTAGSNGTVVGTGDSLTEGSGDSFNVQNTGSGTDKVVFSGTGDYVGLLGGSGYTVTGSNGGIETFTNTSFNVTGDNDTIGTDVPVGSTAGSNGTVVGTGDSLTEGSGDSFNVTNTGSGTDNVVFSGTGDYVGLLGGSGYTVTGSNGGIETFTNTSFNVTGDNDTIGTDVPVGSTAGSNGTVVGTGDSLTEGSGDSFNVQNTGSGTDKVVFSGTGDYVGLLGGSGYTVTGSNGGIETFTNTSFNVTGDNDTIGTDVPVGSTAGSNGTVVGTGDSLTEGSGDSFNVTNTGSGTDNVVFSGTGDYVGLLGGSGYTVTGSNGGIETFTNTSFNVTGDNDTIGTDVPVGSTAGSNGTVVGTGDSLTEGSGDSFNVQNTGSGTDKVVFSGTGDYVGLLGGSGYTVTGSNGGIETFTNTSFNVTGDNDTIGTDVPVGSTAGSNGTVVGTGDSLTEGSGDSFNVQNTGSGTDKVVFSGTGDYVGLLGGSGYTVTGSNGGIETFTNTSFNVTGDNDTIGTDVPVGSTAGSNGTVVGTGDSLTEGSGDSFNVQNTGSGTDKVVFSGTGDYVGLLGGSGYTVTGSNGGIETFTNTSFNVTGDNDTIGTDVPVGSTAGSNGTVVGTGDSLTEGSGDSFNVTNTGSGTDKVVFSGTGDYVGLLGGSGYTVAGSNGGIETFTNTSFNVTGDNDTIGTDVPVGSTAGSNGTVVGTGDSLTEGSGDSFNVTNTGSGTDNVVFSGTGDYVGLLGGSGYTVAGSNGGIETFTNTSFNVTGDNDTIGTDVPVGSTAGSNGTVVGTGDSLTEGSGDSFNVQNTGSGTDKVVFSGTGDYVGLLGGSGYTVTGSSGGIATLTNTSFNVTGDNDTIATDVPSGTSTAGSSGTIIGNNNKVTLGHGDNFVVAGNSNTIMLTGDTLKLSNGFSNMVFLAAGNSTLTDSSSGTTISVSSTSGNLILSNIANDPSFVIGLTGGVGGYTSATNVVSALQKDGNGGTLLYLGSGSNASSIDFVNTSQNTFNSSHFVVSH